MNSEEIDFAQVGVVWLEESPVPIEPTGTGKAVARLREGRLVVCAWLASDKPAPWQVRHLLEPICSEGRLPSMLTAHEYRDVASAAGFRCVDYRDISQSVARTWSICFRRFLRAMCVDGAMRRRILARA